MQLKVGFAHESPNLNLFLLLTPANLFFLKSVWGRPYLPWLAVPVSSAVCPSLSLLQCDFWCGWKVARDIWTVGFAGWWH